jgi:hypothetical protein
MRTRDMIWGIRIVLEHLLSFNDMRILFFTISLAFLFGCTNQEADSLPAPSVVQMVPHHADTSAVENGIDAIPEYDAIGLGWYKLADRNVTHYNIYRRSGDELRFSRIHSISLENVSSPFDTTFIDNSVEINKYYYYYVTATNKDNKESAVPDTAYRYMITPKAELIRPTTNDQISGMPVFTWNFIEIPNQFILRIEEDFTNQLHFVRVLDVDDFSTHIQSFDLATIADVEPFVEGMTYKWRIDCIGPDGNASGSESDWLRFRIQ